MEDNIFDKVQEVDLQKKMEESYIEYAMSVIASRALPDVRDGLKPVLDIRFAYTAAVSRIFQKLGIQRKTSVIDPFRISGETSVNSSP